MAELTVDNQHRRRGCQPLRPLVGGWREEDHQTGRVRLAEDTTDVSAPVNLYQVCRPLGRLARQGTRGAGLRGGGCIRAGERGSAAWA